MFTTAHHWRSSFLWDVTQRSYRRFGRTYQSDLQWSHRRFRSHFKVEERTYRLSRNVGNYQYTLHNTLKEQRSPLYRVGSLKSSSSLTSCYPQTSKFSPYPSIKISYNSALMPGCSRYLPLSIRGTRWAVGSACHMVVTYCSTLIRGCKLCDQAT